MSYKIWTQQTDSDANFTIAELANGAKLAGVKVLSHKFLGAEWPQDIVINIIDGKPPCDTFKCGPLLIVNEKIRQILEHFSSDIEYLSVYINKNDHYYDGYYFVNVVASEDILERENSVYDEFDNEIEDISLLRLLDRDVASSIFS
ncbi:hypothetical protein [Photobacterium damselae]|uniref:hypothetical protein n=1 Tax=Photobacterium damselae TaxID=38293 RepID=UPI001302C497|nr:hypothetical protein [Photobacterium damselae]